MSEVGPVPQGSLLLHIGPQKTGSTSIQASMHDAREDLVSHGVFYPGPFARQVEAGWAVLGGAPLGRTAPRIEAWHELVQELRASTLPRRVLSNEDLSRGDDDVVERIVSDLGGDGIELLFVARRYDQLLPSHWQERLKARMTLSFEDFLRSVLEGDPASWESRLMWDCQLPDQVLASWGRFVPPERITVIVLDDDHSLLPRTFEQLLGLPAGLLVAPDQVQNRSYTFPEAEALRSINQLAARERWTNRHYLEVIRRGVARDWTNSPRPVGAARIPGLPAWALDRVSGLADRQADALLASGCRLVGPPDTLRTRGRVTAYDGPMSLEDLPFDLLGEAVGLTIARTRYLRERALDRQRDQLGGRNAEHSGAAQRVRELGSRIARRVRRSEG